MEALSRSDVKEAEMAGRAAVRYALEGETDQIVTLVREPGQSRRGRQPAGVAAHHLDDGNRRGFPHRPGVLARADGGQSHEAGGAAVPRRVVGQHQIVVDGLGHVDYRQIVASLAGGKPQTVPSLGGVVAADGK